MGGLEAPPRTDLRPPYSQESYMEIRKLNMLRGIAAMIVVIQHYTSNTNIFRGALGNGAGTFGVMFFFILSGFLMSYLYMNKKFDKENIKHFVVARIARVVPLFVLVVSASFLFQTLGLNEILFAVNDIKSLVLHLLFLSGVNVLWTIPPEIQFYILFLFLWWFYYQKRGYLYVLIVIIFICLIFLNFPTPQWKVLGLDIQIMLIQSLPYFLVGVIFGQIYCTWEAPNYLRKNIFVLALLFVPLMYPNIFIFLMKHEHKLWTDAGIFFVVSAVFFALVFLVPDNNPLLANKLGDFMGKISYSLYLLHVPVMNLIIVPSKKSPEIFFFLFIAVSIFTAYISYLIIESPARRGIRSFISNRSALSLK